MKLSGTERIETKRLVLRKFVMEDGEDMFNNWANDPKVTKYLTWPTHENIDVSKSVLNDWINNYSKGNFFNWAIEYKESGKVIGNIAVVKYDENTLTADIGYCLSYSFWGKGIMPEALKAVIDYLFNEVGLNRVTAFHDVNNGKSGRVMEKAGMKKEKTLYSAGKNNQGICDVVCYSIERNDVNQE